MAEEKLDWIYKNANSLVSREEYLLGRKVDTALEQLNDEEKERKIVLPTPKNHVEHECIPPSIRDFNKIVHAEQVDLSAKLQEDPLVAIRKREEEARRKFLQNPVQLKKLQDALKQQEHEKKNKKLHKKQSEKELDQKIKEKLKLLKSEPFDKKLKKRVKDDALNTILMHKFNALKDKLTDSDLNDIMNGKTDSSSDESDSDHKKKKKKKRENSEGEESDEKSSHKKKERHFISKKEEKEIKRAPKNRYGEREDKKFSNHYEGKYSNKQSDSYKTRKSRSRSNSRDKRRHFMTKEKLVQDKKYSESDSDEEEYHRRKNKQFKRANSSNDEQDNKRKHIMNNSTSNDGLDEKIMARLRMLRNAVELSHQEINGDAKSSKKQLLPKRPHHLENQKSSSSSSEDSESDNNDSDGEIIQKKRFGLVSSDGKRIALKRTEGPKLIDKKPAKQVETVFRSGKTAKRLTEEEKEKLRKEMMQNAVVRDKERAHNLKKHRESEKQEENNSLNYDKELIHNQLLKSAKQFSVEDRIKSKLNNIQRSSRHMDSNFAKR